MKPRGLGTLLLMLVFLGSLQACGQKGSLYLPDTVEQQEATPDEAQDEDEEESEQP